MASLMKSSRIAARLVRSVSKVTRRGYADQMDFTLASGNQVFYANQSVKQVDVPSFSGAFGILPSHVPTLAILKPGVITVYENEGMYLVLVFFSFLFLLFIINF